MSLSTLRKNFYRIASLIIDHGAESMRCLLDQFIRTKYGMSFRDFVSNHQHEIYHLFNNGICCLCSKSYRRPFKTIISAWQMDKLFDIKNPKLSGHKDSSKCEYCCSIVKSTLQIQDIDITLLRFVLVTYFEEEFWQSCFTSGIVFHDFLNTHKHDIFHLLQLNTSCCLCQAHPGYMVMVVTEKDRLNRTQWETMFQVPELPCIQHRIPKGKPLNPCSVSATIGIRHSDLDGRARMTILSKFCAMMRHIEVLVNARNTVFAHAIKGELSDEEFRQLWNEIENSIIYVSNITSTVDSQKLCISKLREKSLEESLCLELQCLILKQMHGDELVLEACRKLQDTVEMVKESIDLKLQQIESQITAFTSNMSDVVRNELNEYSDTTRNIIDNTRREIEFHDEDNTYVETSAVTIATKQLHSNNLLIIFGRAGSGKTSTALQIASLFHAKGYIIMKLEQNLAKDFKTYFRSNNKQLIIFEDLFGKADIRYNADIHSNLLEVLKPHVFNGVSKFVITVRSYKSEIDDEIATNQLLSEAGVVDLNGSLSHSEKKRILTRHATHNGLEICSSYMQDIIDTDSYLGFPEASRLFCSFEKFFAMGHVFFTSPTEVLQNEMSILKRSGNIVDSELQYCVLICLMMDSACKDSFGKNIHRVAHENNDSSNNYKNINCSVIEYLYNSIYHKKKMISIDDLHQICKKLTNTYIKKDLNSNTYVFQHQTVFEVVLSSYWHPTTMADVIKFFDVDILVEYVRAFDSIVKGYKKYLIVPMNKCTDLAHKLFETFLANCNEFLNCYSLIKLIEQSKFILNAFNLKLDEWCTKGENIHKCEWMLINNFIRPFNYKKENNKICGNVDDNYLIERLMKELKNGACNVKRYIEIYGSNDFLKKFNAKVKEWFQSEENVKNCKWEVIDYFVRPTSFAIENCQMQNSNAWLIQRLIHILMKPESSKHPADTRAWMIENYIKRYGCEEFVISFNIKLAEWFQSEKNVANCEWPVIDYFIRPTSFTIENGQICTVPNDGWLIQRLIHILMKPESSKDSVDTRVWSIERYLKRYGCEEFVNSFKKNLAEWFHSEENVANCEWPVIDYFIRPTSFTIENGQICTVTNDSWLIQRLIHILMKPESFKHSVDTRAWSIERYIKRYGCEEFVISFNIKLAEWFQSEENVANCEWPVIDYFIRPTSFKIENGHICTVTNDGWLIQRLIHILMKPESSKDPVDVRAPNIESYIKRYGCQKFVNSFKKNLAEWFQSEENVANCEWDVIDDFIRPTSFTIENGQIGTVTNDGWLIQRLIHILMKPESSKDPVDVRARNIESYIKRYGCQKFVNSFKKNLAEWFQSEENVANCEWDVIDDFIRPTSFTIENGQIGTVTNDGWLIQRLIHILMKPESSKDPVDVRARNIESYIKRYGCQKFVNSFKKNLAEWFQSEENVANCDWDVIDDFIRPTSFTIENDQICTTTTDCWLIQRLFTIMMKSDDVRLRSIEEYIKEYGCAEFVNSFNEKLAEWFQSEDNVANCDWYVLDYFIRPTSFTIENGQIGTVTNDGWLIQRLIHILMKPESSKDPVDVRARNIESYIKRYGCQKFVNSFKKNLAEWFQSEENVANCEWDVIDDFIRPTSFTIENGQIGTVTNDGWLIQRLIHILMKPESSKDPVDVRARNIESYIKRYGCQKFVNSFKKNLAEWFQSEENVANCEWDVIDDFIRPTSFTIENGQIGTVTNDGWLIQRLIHILMKPESSKDPVDVRARNIESYIKRYGCQKFVNSFKKNLAEWFQSEENVANCDWDVIDDFIRPTSFTIEHDQICTTTTDCWLIQRLFTIMMKSDDVRLRSIEEYIKEYGCAEFVNSFNEKLAEWFQSEDNVANCDWYVLDYFIRPTSFTIENGQIGTVTNYGWLIQRLIHILMKPESSKHSVDTRAWSIERYIKEYGCEEFVISFNIKLAEWFQSEENVANCEWPVIDYFIRPTSFTIENGQICTVTNDGWLIQRLIHILMKPESSKHSADTRAWMIENYIKRYGCEEFVISFNIKLAEWFQSEKNVANCEWKVIDYFIRPTSFTIENGQICTVTNDGWLIQRLIHILMKPESSKHSADTRAWMIENYIKRYGCEEFVISFNIKLAEWFQSEENVANCEWPVIDDFIRPTSFTIENGQIGTVTNDGWLIQRLIHILMKPESSKDQVDVRARSIHVYITEYGCEEFVNSFKKKLAECIQAEENVVNCNLHVFTSFVRPQSWLCFEKIGIYIQDERVVMYLFSKLEQPKNINAVKSYIRSYGTNDFITNFNERLKEKVERNPAFDQQCTWECLERFFDNVAASDPNDINDFSQGFDIDMDVVTEIDSSISIDTNSLSADSETDSNIDVDSSNSSEDSESDSNIDVDSSNQHSDNETSHQPSSKSGCKNGVLIMKE
ncbi:uncharacterized protein [Mytilus edulis]|uniref:uncharacterized protein n=1 Tax=Mytilus edulis TaxID=6550 RepID=UPI0039F0275D